MDEELTEMKQQAELADRRLTKLEGQLADEKYLNKFMNEKLNEAKAKLTHRDTLADDIKSVDFSILESANPKLLSEIFTLLKIVQNTVALQSLKTRQVDGIAYRDGAIDALELIKAKLKEFYKVTTTTRKKQKEAIDAIAED